MTDQVTRDKIHEVEKKAICGDRHALNMLISAFRRYRMVVNTYVDDPPNQYRFDEINNDLVECADELFRRENANG